MHQYLIPEIQEKLFFLDLGKNKKTFAELYLIKTERTGTSHTEATNLKYELTAAVCLPDK